MSLLRTSHLIFAAASLAAVAIPWMLIARPHVTNEPHFPFEALGGNAQIDPAPPLAALEGRLFYGGTPQPVLADANTPTDAATAQTPPEPPRLVGTAISRHGRAVAVMRTAAGETRMVARGDSIDGWRVVQISNAQIRIRLGGDTRTIIIERGNPAPPSLTPTPSLASNRGGSSQ